MILTKFFTLAANVTFADPKTEIALSCFSPWGLRNFIRSTWDPKKHDVAFLIAFHNSKWAMYIEHPDDVPHEDIRCPKTGNYLLKYDLEDIDKNRYKCRISESTPLNIRAG